MASESEVTKLISKIVKPKDVKVNKLTTDNCPWYTSKGVGKAKDEPKHAVHVYSTANKMTIWLSNRRKRVMKPIVYACYQLLKHDNCLVLSTLIDKLAYLYLPTYIFKHHRFYAYKSTGVFIKTLHQNTYCVSLHPAMFNLLESMKFADKVKYYVEEYEQRIISHSNLLPPNFYQNVHNENPKSVEKESNVVQNDSTNSINSSTNIDNDSTRNSHVKPTSILKRKSPEPYTKTQDQDQDQKLLEENKCFDELLETCYIQDVVDIDTYHAAEQLPECAKVKFGNIYKFKCIQNNKP